ncbi:tRNA preQ1(34) S-adenosylmethionine ribosyltransferase-isomerase QueA [Lutibaculum baratangense]|uniref:S-adenosylmethionine:tRNA ribosyltransferase-isomerase n=1 Tax=Lutibaculum baratangense AMV1 TaxID=631454 RepID=V4TL70_9HYPH|nr:tRNA preQ1(34) S-adenosylmethionine ribosyltransferase-isomerase QueA [Lutibaculum baratangense]ESR26568.1 S-adenosylmethionine:tRNA ribosyltransferase-isomerase [Lutibaculum baratangense AMV1]
MRVDLFDFELPEELIALRPAEPRGASRLLVVRPGATPETEDRAFADLPKLLVSGDVLVFNDTRVIPARLFGRRTGRGETEPRIEVTLHKRAGEDGWHAFARPARKLELGDCVDFGDGNGACLLGALAATVEAKGEGGEILLRFELSGAALDEVIEAVGEIPLPPYIASRRPADMRDRQDYQTVYAREAGAVAAPTAGLHFTPEVMGELSSRGIGSETLTLHVGAGTFLPVKADDTADHRMHAETGRIDAEVAARLNDARARGGRIVAVGTTALRLLESAATPEGLIEPFAGDTDIFITPGYRFRGADLLVTNFHLPRSTLFMLVSAFSGLETMRGAYAHAVAARYRFYSYGDSCLLFPSEAR